MGVGVGGRGTQQSNKSEEEEMEEIYCDEFELMDDFMPSEKDFCQSKSKSVTASDGHAQGKDTQVGDVSLHPIDKAKVNVIDMTDEEERPVFSRLMVAPPADSHSGHGSAHTTHERLHSTNDNTTTQPRPNTTSNAIESLFRTSDVINLQHLEGSGLEIKVTDSPRSRPLTAVSPPPPAHVDLSKSSVSKDFIHDVYVPSPPSTQPSPRLHSGDNSDSRDALLSETSTTPVVTASTTEPATANARTASSNLHELDDASSTKDGARQRMFFLDLVACSDVSSAVALCNQGYIEGNATSIKKFSVVEKKIKIPHFLTRLEFSDGRTSRDVRISSHLCQKFLQMSAQDYIEARNKFIVVRQLGKKEGSNEFKREFVLKFGNFSGRFLTSFVDGECVLEDVLS